MPTILRRRLDPEQSSWTQRDSAFSDRPDPASCLTRAPIGAANLATVTSPMVGAAIT